MDISPAQGIRQPKLKKEALKAGYCTQPFISVSLQASKGNLLSRNFVPFLRGSLQASKGNLLSRNFAFLQMYSSGL